MQRGRGISWAGGRASNSWRIEEKSCTADGRNPLAAPPAGNLGMRSSGTESTHTTREGGGQDPSLYLRDHGFYRGECDYKKEMLEALEAVIATITISCNMVDC